MSTLTGFAAKLMTIAAFAEKHRALEAAGKVIEDEIKSALGTYKYGWPPLSEKTQETRQKKGFSPNEPLLETGELRDSIHTRVSGNSVFIGSNEDRAVAQELGTSRVPPRSFLMEGAKRKAREAAETAAKILFDPFRR